MDYEIDISITDNANYTSDIIQSMADIVGYLRYKVNLTVIELKVIETYDSFYREIDKDIDGKPSL